MVLVVYETHSISEDNEAGIATGWLPGKLSATGRSGAAALGQRRRNDGVDVVFTSDLGRATETAAIAFGGSGIAVIEDSRLRECNYGEMNGTPVAGFVGRRHEYVDVPYPGGESWRQAVARLDDFLHDLARDHHGKRVVLVGHSAQRFGFEHLLRGRPFQELVDADFDWQEGWEYTYG